LYEWFSLGDGNLYMKPDLFGRPSRVGFRVPEQEDKSSAALIDYRIGKPKYLERRMSPGKRPFSGSDNSSSDSVRGSLGSYSPLWHSDAAFSRESGGDALAFVQVSGKLAQYEFTLDQSRVKHLEKGEKPWQVVVYVEVGEGGGPEHVFLETGCDDPEINAAVVRAMYYGKVSSSGTACSGRVTISCGVQ